jgi:type IV secretory pathway VirB2 component (pilin)
MRVVTLLVMIGLAAVPAFAANEDFGLGDRVKIILDFLGSPWVKGVALIALIAECIGMMTAGRQEPGMFKKFIPWIAGTLLFLAAGTITSKFMEGVSTSSFSNILN